VTGIALVTHNGLGEAIRHEVENILGQPVSMVTVAIGYHADVGETLETLRTAFAAGADTQGIMVLTDLPGATPHNLACQAADELGIPVVSGLNLPMLLKVTNHADKPPAELAKLAAGGGIQGIVQA